MNIFCKLAFSALFLVSGTAVSSASDFDRNFCDSTLRVDYIFGGGPAGTRILLRNQTKSDGWYGRRHNLEQPVWAGNGDIRVCDAQNGETLYISPFSSLFQEWLAMPEAQTTDRAFENSFLVPLPRREADIVVTLRDNTNQPTSVMKYRYNPNDELVVRAKGEALPHRYIHSGGDPKKCIDVALLAEGYTVAEMDSFLVHATRATDELLRYEPYASNRDKFNFVAVMSPSNDSGVSVPLRGDWKDTAFGAHFSTFHMPRYMTVPNVFNVYDALDGIPAEHIMILVNTDIYGGGGIFNAYHISAARNEFTLPVSVHEFGHSFGGLADEYFYENEENDMYRSDVEPWEPNITTLVDFDSKWKDMVDPSTPVPTPWQEFQGTREEKQMYYRESARKGATPVGAYEGGGYKAHGVYRPTVTCRMRDNYFPSFCRVCESALQHVIDYYYNDDK